MKPNKSKMVVKQVYLAPDKKICISGELLEGSLQPGDILEVSEAEELQDKKAETAAPEISETAEHLQGSSFMMPIDAVFSSIRGTIVAGNVERGVLRKGDKLEIVGLGHTIGTACVAIEKFLENDISQCAAGEYVGVLLENVSKADVWCGQVLATPGTISLHTDFTCKCYILSEEEGGRPAPFFNNYFPQFLFRATGVMGSIELPEGTVMACPGDDITMTVKLTRPTVINEGSRFVILDTGNIVGTGTVSKILK